jgi:hypothetical protein
MNNPFCTFSASQSTTSLHNPSGNSSSQNTFGFNNTSTSDKIPTTAILNKFPQENSFNVQSKSSFMNSTFGTSTGLTPPFGLKSKSKPFFGTSHSESDQPPKFPVHSLCFTSQTNNTPMDTNETQESSNNEKSIGQSKPFDIKKDNTSINKKVPNFPNSNIMAKSSTVKPGTNIFGAPFNNSTF